MVSAIYEHECENGFIDYQCVLLFLLVLFQNIQTHYTSKSWTTA